MYLPSALALPLGHASPTAEMRPVARPRLRNASKGEYLVEGVGGRTRIRGQD
jgi:hypothetical protein